MEHQETMFTACRYHRNCSPALYNQGCIISSKSDSTLSSHTLHRGHEKKRDEPPSPSRGNPLGFGLFPEKGRTGSLLSPAYCAEEIRASVSNHFPITYILKETSADQM